jgi:glycerol-3-phosphate dehydrogenase (NAD(P)+)
MTSAPPFEKVLIVGGGAWGTALALQTRRNGAATIIWAREAEVVEAINARRENTIFLPGVRLDPEIAATADMAVARACDAVLFVTPVQFARGALTALSGHVAACAPIALCSKGLETGRGLLLTEILAETAPGLRPAVISGPSFARDVALGAPTAVTLACADAGLGARWIATIGAAHFRPYLSDDVVGAEIGGAVKNVLAIAAGVVAGRGLGESAKAALIARGFAELQRFGVALGARRETMAGLSGLGDLILTATSTQSRNYSLGVELGRGGDLQTILSARRSVAEGAASAGAVVARARTLGVDMPICRATAELVAGARSLDDIIADLLARPFRPETS